MENQYENRTSAPTTIAVARPPLSSRKKGTSTLPSKAWRERVRDGRSMSKVREIRLVVLLLLHRDCKDALASLLIDLAPSPSLHTAATFATTRNLSETSLELELWW